MMSFMDNWFGIGKGEFNSTPGLFSILAHTRKYFLNCVKKEFHRTEVSDSMTICLRKLNEISTGALRGPFLPKYHAFHFLQVFACQVFGSIFKWSVWATGVIWCSYNQNNYQNTFWCGIWYNTRLSAARYQFPIFVTRTNRLTCQSEKRLIGKRAILSLVASSFVAPYFQIRWWINFSFGEFIFFSEEFMKICFHPFSFQGLGKER